jgi:serine/threonine protein kinase
MPGTDSLIGQTVSHYRILEKLGGGGMGVVYKAEDTRLSRNVALKFLPDNVAKDPQALARFQREAQAASALNHPNIGIYTTSAKRTAERLSQWNFSEGKTLKHTVAGRPMKFKARWRLQRDGLNLHTEGNHPPRHQAGEYRYRVAIKILDFGLQEFPQKTALARGKHWPARAGPRYLQWRGTLGTVAYMSPEQARPKSMYADLFSSEPSCTRWRLGRCRSVAILQRRFLTAS